MGNTLSKEESVKKSKEMFGSLSDEVIHKILSQYKYNVYDAIPALSQENEKKEEENKKLLNEKKEKGDQDFVDHVIEEFKLLGKEEIEKKFNENQHDPKKTLKEIVKSMSKKSFEGNDEERFVSAVQEKYPNLTKEEIVQQLKDTPNREEALSKLIELSHNKVFQNLKMAHKDLEDKIIFACCEKANWVFNEALKLCDKCKTTDPKDVLEVQAGTIEYLAKEMLDNLEKNEVDPKAMEVQAGTIEYLAQDMEKNIKQLSQYKAKQFIVEDNEHKELENQKRVELATDAMQPILHNLIEPKKEVEKSDKDLLDFKVVEKSIHVSVSLAEATSNSWIGLFRKGDANNNYITYNWLSYLKEKTFTVDIPSINGDYEFRVFKDKTTLVLTKDYSVKSEDSFKLVLEETTVTIHFLIFTFDVVKESAWVSIHSVGEERPGQYRRSAWLKNNSGSVTFKRLQHEGNYEARIYTKGYFSSTLKMKSNSVEIKL